MDVRMVLAKKYIIGLQETSNELDPKLFIIIIIIVVVNINIIIIIIIIIISIISIIPPMTYSTSYPMHIVRFDSNDQ